ncbi:hypothetical protein [Aeoliella mucimassa]|uniref:Flagellar protein FliL n=1 Tax=Aeoliella mucimassa TaxID=2527972 RepID=A0A518AHT8_9BACT|nr:hypothetical protein [Aeoliella mucimassa]QDU54292.1 hypothetical protein Pan181_04730 [Aeoliella mucimassa]
MTYQASSTPSVFAPRCGLLLLAVLLLSASCAPLAGAADAKAKAKKGDKEDKEAEPEVPPPHAYKLGDFHIKNYRPVEREKVTLSFTVYAEVEDEYNELFEKIWDVRQHRVRNQIITSARLMDPNLFDDPTLHAFRRRIYLRLRRAFPELLIHEIYISDFSYMLE